MARRFTIPGACNLAWLAWLASLAAASGAGAQSGPSSPTLRRGVPPGPAAELVAARPAEALPSGAVKLAAAADPVAPVPAAPRTIRMPLSLEGLSAHGTAGDKIRVTSGDATITRGAGGAPTLELPAEGSVIVSSEPGRSSAAHSEIGVDRKTPLPWLVIETSRSPRGPVVRTARPFLTLARAILWNAAEQRHIAEFLFGLDPESGEPGPLERPIDARFSVTCDDVAPAAARIAQIGPAGYGTVRVACSRAIKNERPEHALQVHVDRGNLSYPFRIPRRPGALLLKGSSRVAGFGFGSLVLTAGMLEEDGSALAVAHELPVQLVVERGALDVNGLTIPSGAREVSVQAHPPGIGPLTVLALAGEQRSAPLSVELVWPVLPVLAIVLGGTLGGALSAIGAGRTRRRLRRRAIEGALVGLFISAVALVLPSFVALPSWARQTELGLFVVAALSGYVGTRLLDRAARVIFPTLAGDEKP